MPKMLYGYRKIYTLGNFILCILFLVIFMVGLFFDEYINKSVFLFLKGDSLLMVLFWGLLPIILLLIFLFSASHVLSLLKNRKLYPVFFVCVGFLLGSILLQFFLYEPWRGSSFNHWTYEGPRPANICGIFLNPFNYIFAVPLALVGLLIDGVIYLIRKRRQIIN